MENYRLLMALLLSLGIIFIYNQLLAWRHPELAHRQAQVAASPTPAPEATESGAAPHGAIAGSAGGNAAAIAASPEQTVQIDTKLYTAIVTTHGGRLRSFRLKDYKQTSAANSLDYQMIAGGDRLPIGLVFARGGANLDDGEVNYTTAAPAEITATGDVTVTLKGSTGDGVALTKSFTFHLDSYVFEVTGAASAAAGAKIDGIGLRMSRPLTANAGFRDVPELQADVGGKVVNEMQKAIEKGVAESSGPVTYAGFGDRYFLAVLMPIRPTDGTLTMDYADDEADEQVIFNGARQVTSGVYMGPKELDALDAVNPALSKSINFGWAGIIALPFLKLLKIFYRIAPNYGLAIILLTVVVRLTTLPMSIKGQRSMMRMQRLQPQVERIREKHKDDQERLNREMVDLYKRNHVNPLGGCLPMAVQLPVFLGLYEALLNAIELRHAPFFGWIRDLSAPDCLPIHWMPAVPLMDCHGLPVLVILMTGTAFLQQYMMPRQPDPSQQKMMMYMPVFFSLIFLNMPAGLTLYYFFSNVLGIVQQFVLNREFQQLPSST
ncbi:MAG TPA: membrane protein insertase YidC [Candidatus Binataceae bacterium]|nr:membrane protein insertase YidC [Candidatus Binataceae bacterium]